MGVPFAVPGDSGSLVFAMEDGIHIPLGFTLVPQKACLTQEFY
jgi:hypothetical protein